MDFGGYGAFEDAELSLELEAPTLPVDVVATTSASMKAWPRTHRALASLVTQAQRSYASLIRQGARVLISTSAGHSSQRVLVLVPPRLDPRRPFDVRVHYHGMWSTASKPASAADLPARIWPQMNREKPTVFVFPFAVMVDHATGGKASFPNWKAAAQSRKTALEGLALAGISARPARVVVSGHSAGGYALASLAAAGGLDCDVLVLEDCLYGRVKREVMRWATTPMGRACREVISFHGSNTTWICPADLPNQKLTHVCGKSHYSYALLDVDGAWPRCRCPAPKSSRRAAVKHEGFESEAEIEGGGELQAETALATVARTSLLPYVLTALPATMANALNICKLVALYFEVPWPLVFAVLEHEGGLRLRGHDDGVMQTIDGSRTDALSQIPLELKQSLVTDGALTGGALDAKLLKAFHNGSNRTRQLATQIAFGTAELKAWLDRYERYVALGFAAYNTGSGPKPWVAAQKNATSRAERCRQAASTYHQPTSAILISEGTWICDPQMKGSGWAWRAKILDGQTGRSIRGYQYLRSVASNCPKPPTSVCSAKTQREACSQPLTSRGTRLGILDKLFNPSLMRRPYSAVIRTAWPVLPDDGRPLRAVGTKLVLEPSAAWQ